MRIVPLAVICGLIAMTGGCGTLPPTYASVRASVESVELRALLTALNGLPEGFSIRVRPPWRAPFRPREKAGRPVLDAVAGRPPRDGLTGTTAGTFEGVHVGELGGVGLATYEGSAAAEHFAELRDALADCEVADRDTAGEVNRLSASALPMPVPGTASVTRRLTGRVGGYPYEMHLVVALAGNTLVALVHAGLAPPDAVLTRELADVVARKVGTLEP
jgi:hypothetical protein